nr:hypothetical protein [Tanacetum cinerariifolium]
MPWSSTLKTTIPLRICPIVPLSICNVSVARTSAVAGKVPYFVALVALLGTQAIVMKMALGALGQISTPACRPSLVSCPSLLGESLLSVTVANGQSLKVLPSLSAASESGSHATAAVSGSVYSATIAVLGVPEVGTFVHILAREGSEAHDVLSSLTLQIEPKPLGQHKPPPTRSILAYKSWVSCSWSSANSVTLVLTFSKVVDAISGIASAGSIQSTPQPLIELFPTSYLDPSVDKHNLLLGSYSNSGIPSLWSTGGGGYENSGSGGDDNASEAVNGQKSGTKREA